MAAITASMVAELRAKTDAPMMECKKALTEAEGNFEKAEELLRVKLGNKAGKAAARITAEGVVTASISGSTGAMDAQHQADRRTASAASASARAAFAVLLCPYFSDSWRGRIAS